MTKSKNLRIKPSVGARFIAPFDMGARASRLRVLMKAGKARVQTSCKGRNVYNLRCKPADNEFHLLLHIYELHLFSSVTDALFVALRRRDACAPRSGAPRTFQAERGLYDNAFSTNTLSLWTVR